MATSNITLDDVFLNGHDIASNTDLNTLTVPGVYRSASGVVSSTLTNCPHTGSAFAMINFKALAGSPPIQMIFTGERIYARRYANNAWGSWYYYAGTKIT